MVFVPTEGVSSQAIRNNSKAIEQEITKRFEDMKTNFLQNAYQQLVDKNPGCLKRDLETKWNDHIQQRITEQKAEAEETVQAHLQTWVETEVQTRTKKLQDRLTSETASEALTTLHEHAAAIGYKLVPVAAKVHEPSGEPFSLVPDSQMTDPIEDFSQPDAIDALASTRAAAVGGAASSIHNPANQMVDDLTPQVEPKPVAPTTHQPSGDDTAPALVKCSWKVSPALQIGLTPLKPA